MNPHLCRIALRPRTALESFDLALRLVRRHWSRYLTLGAQLVLPALAVVLVVWALLPADDRWIVVFVTLVVGPIIQAPFTVLTGRLLFDDDVAVGTILREVRGRFFGMLQAWLAQTAALLLGLCTGLFWMITLPVTAYVYETAMLERVAAQGMLSRSSYLAWKNFGVAMAATLGGMALVGWGGFVGEYAGQALVGFVLQLGQPFGSLSQLQLTPYPLVGMLLIQPLVATYRLLLYVDVRTRVEGWDLQVVLRAAGLGASADGEAA